MERAMMRLRVVSTALLCLAAAAPDAARACDNEQAQVVVVSVSDDTPAPPAEQAPRPPRPPRSKRTPEAPPAAVAPETPAPAAAPMVSVDIEAPAPPAALLPRGWFGFAIEGSMRTRRTGDSTVVWRFFDMPRVYSVEVGSPAQRAGFQRGDVITSIDGVSILTSDGGRRFGRIRPNQVVRWTVIRDGNQRTVVARASENPLRRERVQLLQLRRDMARMKAMTDNEELRRQISDFERTMVDYRRAQDDVWRKMVDVRVASSKRFRYATMVGNAEVEVRGPDAVMVSEAGPDEVVISVGETVVRIRTSDIGADRDTTSRPRTRKTSTPK